VRVRFLALLVLTVTLAPGVDNASTADDLKPGWPRAFIDRRIAALEADEAAAKAEWEALLKARAAEINAINAAGGLSESYALGHDAAEKYANLTQPTGVLISGTMYFESPRSCAIDSKLRFYRAYLRLFASDAGDVGDRRWLLEAKAYVEADCRVEHDLADWRLAEPLMRRTEESGTRKPEF
jgi:hypothetical protein